MSHHHDRFIWFLVKTAIVLALITYIFGQLEGLIGNGAGTPLPPQAASTPPPPQQIPSIQPRRAAPSQTP